MNAVIESIRSWPWLWAWLTFFVIVLLRAGATYALGRAIAGGVIRRRELGPKMLAAMAQVSRWGPSAVTLSFFTVGAQTAVNVCAGLAQMSVPRYLSGLIPGAAVWAIIWSTIGMSAFLAVFSGGSERLAWLLVLAVVGVVIILLSRSIRQVGPGREPRKG